jgi:hypothetical protein
MPQEDLMNGRGKHAPFPGDTPTNPEQRRAASKRGRANLA